MENKIKVYLVFNNTIINNINLNIYLWMQTKGQA
nr:MAG TPA: hypothetical protein [Caudoviricetes sp.]